MGIPNRSAWLRMLAPAALAVVLATPAAADLNHYVKITGATQGVFPGNYVGAPFEGQTVGFEYHHLIERPTEGGPTQHQTVISTIAMDEALIPHLIRAMEADEALVVEITFLRPGGAGAEETYATITLSGARVVSLEPLSTDDQNPDLQAYVATVRVRFSYDAIAFQHAPTTDSAALTNGGS